MNSKDQQDRDRAIALAGVVQAAELTLQVASSGRCSQAAAAASIHSIFETQPETPDSVFGGISGVKLGLNTLTDILGRQSGQTELRILQLSLSMLKLGQRLTKDQRLQTHLAEAIELIRPTWLDQREPLDPSLISQLADAYEQNISTQKFRLKVPGNPNILNQPEKVQIVRSLLLAGLRAVFLWRQLGGNQWRLIFHRQSILHQAQKLI